MRARIAAVDAQLVELVAVRARLAREAGAVKAALGRPVVDPEQEAAVLDRAAERACALGLDPALSRAAFTALVALARSVQRDAAAPDPGASGC